MRLSRLERSLWLAGRGPFLAPDGTDGGSDSKTEGEQKADAATAKDDTKDDLDAIEGLGDKGKEAIRKERAAAKAAADALKETQTKLAALERERSEREAAEKQATEAEAAKRGEFEKLAATREEERDAAKADVTRLTAENDQLRAAITQVLDSEWKGLPKEVTDAYLGKEDDPLAKLAFLPHGKTLAAKLADKADAKRGNTSGPRSNTSDTRASDDAARKANAALYRTL